MVDITHITYFEAGGNPLTAEHGCHDSGVIKTDPGLACKNFIYIRQIAALHRCSLVIIISKICDNIIIDIFNYFQIIIGRCRKFHGFGDDFGVCRKVYILVCVQIWTKFILDRHINCLRKKGGITGSLNIFKYADGVGTASGSEGKGFITVM